jgi:hypothetical protein
VRAETNVVLRLLNIKDNRSAFKVRDLTLPLVPSPFHPLGITGWDKISKIVEKFEALLDIKEEIKEEDNDIEETVAKLLEETDEEANKQSDSEISNRVWRYFDEDNYDFQVNHDDFSAMYKEQDKLYKVSCWAWGGRRAARGEREKQNDRKADGSRKKENTSQFGG